MKFHASTACVIFSLLYGCGGGNSDTTNPSAVTPVTNTINEIVIPSSPESLRQNLITSDSEANYQATLDSGTPALEWICSLPDAGQVFLSLFADGNGSYRFNNLVGNAEPFSSALTWETTALDTIFLTLSEADDRALYIIRFENHDQSDRAKRFTAEDSMEGSMACSLASVTLQRGMITYTVK